VAGNIDCAVRRRSSTGCRQCRWQVCRRSAMPSRRRRMGARAHQPPPPPLADTLAAVGSNVLAWFRRVWLTARVCFSIGTFWIVTAWPHMRPGRVAASGAPGARMGKPMRIRDLAFVGAVALALGACEQNQQGPKGDPGATGPAGPPGPAGPATGVRLVRSACDATDCTVQCAADEVLVTAWCGTARNPTNFPTERSATCRGRGAADNSLFAVCAKSAGP
jgi:hypothetical protein